MIFFAHLFFTLSFTCNFSSGVTKANSPTVVSCGGKLVSSFSLGCPLITGGGRRVALSAFQVVFGLLARFVLLNQRLNLMLDCTRKVARDVFFEVYGIRLT